jgi:hypothetical protein
VAAARRQERSIKSAARKASKPAGVGLVCTDGEVHQEVIKRGRRHRDGASRGRRRRQDAVARRGGGGTGSEKAEEGAFGGESGQGA